MNTDHLEATKNTTATLCQLPIRDQTGIIAGTGVGGCVIMIIAYVLRMASKVSFPCEGGIRFISCLWWDDVVMTFAVLEISAVSACSVVLSNMGLGKDIWTLPFENITEILKVRSWSFSSRMPSFLTGSRFTTSMKIFT
jgi:hypothetical protein